MATNTIIYFIFCFLFFLGQLQRIELPPLPAFYLHDGLLFFWLGYIFFKKQRDIFHLAKKINYRKYIPEFIFVSWIIIGWMIAILTNDISFTVVFYVIRFASYISLFYFLRKFHLVKKQYIQWGFYAVGVYLLLFGLLQYAFMPDMRFLTILGWDDHLFRLVGTQFDPNYMGILLVIFFFSLGQIKKYFGNSGVVWYGLQLATLIGITLTFSRATYLSFFVALIISAGFQFKKYLVGILLILLIIFAPKPEGEGVDLTRTASVTARVTTSNDRISNLKPYQMVVGRGLFNTGKPHYTDSLYSRADHAQLEDNVFLLIFNATGIVGMGLFLFLLFKYLWKLYRADRQVVIPITAVLTHSMFNNTVFQPFVFLYLLWSLVSKVDR